MKQHRNYFLIFICLFINYVNSVLAMETPLTPRTQAILVLNQKLNGLEETISLLCQARNQDKQLAQLKEEKQEVQIEELKKELQLTKLVAMKGLADEVEEPKPSAESKKMAVILLQQVGAKGALIAQAIITKHYVCQSLQALIQKSNINPRIKILLQEAAPEVALIAAGAGTYATHRLVEQAPKAYWVFFQIKERFFPHTAISENIDKEAACVTAGLGVASFAMGWMLSMRQEKLMVEHLKAMETLIETLKGLK